MKKKLFILPFTFILITALFSCSNLFNSAFSDSNDSEKSVDGGYQISGTVSPYDFAETSPTRSAFPTAPESAATLYYTVTATHGSTSISENVQGTNGAQFNLKLPSIGDWSISATCFGTDSSRTTVVYKTVKPAVISISNASPSKFASLTLKPLMTSGKTGTLNLEIDGTGLDSSFHPSQIQVECISGNLPDMDDRITYFFNIPTKKYTLKTKDGKALPSGSYTFNINFITPSKNLYFYSVTETVNIYDGLETNRWVKNGNEEYITSDGKFELTDAIVNKFQQESIYVDSSVTNANASGTWLDPYNSLDAAIDRLTASSSVKTIFVSGKLETSKTLDFSDGGNVSHDLTIKKNPRATAKPVIKTTTTSSFIEGGPYKIVIENIDFKGCGNEVGATQTGTNSDPSTKAGAFLYFPSSTGSAEITNCTISDYYSHKGGAISAGANSTTTLTNVDITRCKATKGGAIAVHGNLTYVSGNITDCSATNNGGAIYHESGNLTIEEGVCIGKRNATTIAAITNPDEHKYSNYAYNYGGGIYSEGGTLSLKGLISYNAAENSGGGLYLGQIGFSLTYNPTDELEVSYNYAGNTGGGILYSGFNKKNYDICEKIHHNQAKTGGGLCISPQTNGNTFNIFSPVYNNKAYAETTDDDSFGSGGGIFILSNKNNTFNIKSDDITQNTASNLGGGIFVAGTADTKVNISGILSGNAVSGSNPILSHGIYVHTGKLCLNSDSEISSGQDMYVYNSTSRIEIQDTPSKLGNIKLYLNTNPDDNGFKSGDEIFTGTTEDILKAGLLKITPADVDNYEFIINGTSGYLSRKVYIAGSDSIKLPHGVNETLSANPDRGKKTAPFASLSYASRQFNDNDFITYYIEGTTVEGSATEAENPCIFMDNIPSPKTITVRGYEGGKRATLTGMHNNNEFDEKYSTCFYNVAGKLTISDIDIDGTQSTYLAAVITGDPTLLSTPVTDIYDVNIKNFTFVASGTDPETGVILCNSDFAVINIKRGSIKDCDRTGGAIRARLGNVHISQHEISGCTNAKTGEDAVVTSGGDTWLGYLHLEDTSISGTDSSKSVVKIYGLPSNAGAINVGGDTTIEDGYVYLVNNANITLTSNITSDICAHIKSSDPNTYATVLRVDSNFGRAEQEELLNNNYQKFIYDGTYELKPVITSSIYGYLYGVSYVDGSNGKTGVDGGTGAKDNPFKTVSEAVDVLRTQLNSGTNKNAIVYVAGTTAESDSIKPQLNSNVYLDTLTIKKWPGKTEAVIKRGTVEDSIIIVGTKSTITIEDIDIDGNNVVLTDKNGAGLSIQGGSATLKNVKIYGCKVKQETPPPNANSNSGQGGAIFVRNLSTPASKLYLKGNTVIGSDITGTLSEANSSNCAEEGGAIYFQTTSSASALEIEDTVVIKGNYAASNGGAIYMLLNSLTAKIGGTIRNNAAGTAGGAIYNYGCTSVINGTISGNTSPSGSIYAAFSAKIQLNAKSNIGPDDEVVLFRDPSSSLYGQIYIGGNLTAQSNPIKVSCENPDTNTAYVTGPNPLATRTGIQKLTYNGAFSFITSGDNLGKLEVLPVYVAGSDSGITGNDFNPGTETQPLATVAKAVDLIKNYGGTIYVAGTTSETAVIDFPASVTSEFKIMHWAGKQKAVIKRASAQTSCMIIIRKDNNVTFKDVDIDGSDVSITYTYGPAGIYCSGNSTASLTLENVNVKNMLRSVSDYPLGGAIHSSQTTFTMKGGSITNCRIERLSDGVTSGKGGAIYTYAGTTTLENVTISGNKAEEGNAIHVNSGELELKGSTNFSTAPNDINDIYLYSNASAKIKVIGDLSADKVAVISLPMGANGLTTRTEKTILISSEANGVKNNYQKFSLNSTNYSLLEDGTIIRRVNDFSELSGISKALVQLEDDTTLTYSDFESIKTKDILVKTNGNQLTIQASDTLLTGKLKIDAGDADGNKGIVKFLSGGGSTLSGPAINASGSNAEFEITNADVQISVSQGTDYDGAFKISDGAAFTFENVDFNNLSFSAQTVQYGLFNVDSGNLTYKGGSITNVSGGGYGGTALLVYGSGSAKIELSELTISNISNPSQSTLICAEDNTELVMDAVEITGFSVLSSNSEKSIIRCDSGHTNNKLSLINIHDNDFVSDTSNRYPIAPGIAIKIGTGGYLTIEDSSIHDNYGFYQGCISVAGELIFNNSEVLDNTTSCTQGQFQDSAVNGNAFYVDSSGSLKLKGSSNICDNKMSIEGERPRSPKVHGPAIYINDGEVTKEESVIMTGNKNTNVGMPDNCQVYCVSGTYNGTSYSFTGVPGTEW